MPVDLAPAQSIFDDIARNEPTFPVGDLPAQPWAPRRGDGKKMHKSWAYRSTQRGPNKLETMKIGGVMMTTRGAYLRWIAAANGRQVPSEFRTSARRERDVAVADESLEKRGW